MSGRRASMKSIGDAPCTRPQRLSTLHGDPVQVKRIASSAHVWQAATLAIGAARFRRKPAPGLPSAASTPRGGRGSHRAKRCGTGFSRRDTVRPRTKCHHPSLIYPGGRRRHDFPVKSVNEPTRQIPDLMILSGMTEDVDLSPFMARTNYHL
jgi:hypothetical protein